MMRGVGREREMEGGKKGDGAKPRRHTVPHGDVRGERETEGHVIKLIFRVQCRL